MTKISFFVQARVGSTRLPNKIILPFYKEKSILELLVDKLKQFQDIDIIIATSSNSNCDIIESFARKNRVKCFRGAENDVLQRFIDAADYYNVNQVIRVCSDNPFLELESIKCLIKEIEDNNEADYISFNIGGKPSIKTHYGFWTEYVKVAALKRVKELTAESIYHEHVTNFIYANTDIFEVRWIDGPRTILKHPNIRLTIDTIEDFQNAQNIYSDICATNPYPAIDEVIAYLDSHDDYYEMMKKQIEKNIK